MKFLDRVILEVASGSGGGGAVSFSRQKYVPKGGPDGGDGGAGGNVFFKVSSSYNSFVHLEKKYLAGDGKRGGPNNKTGACGEDRVISVPPGTVVQMDPKMLQEEKEELLDLLPFSVKHGIIKDLKDEKKQWLFLKGGRGGKGNSFFTSSSRQAPQYAQPGERGYRFKVVLELKSIADVGFVGFPNAGKSSLLRRLSKARPKVAEYPFTTLTPQLGVLEVNDVQIVLADIPGILEGAHQNVGLGWEFLRHIERTKLFLFVFDSFIEDPLVQYEKLKKELGLYFAQKKQKASELENLLDRPMGYFSEDKGEKGDLKVQKLLFSEEKVLLVLNKKDMMAEKKVEKTVRRFQDQGLRALAVSALTGEGTEKLKYEIFGRFHKEIQKEKG